MGKFSVLVTGANGQLGSEIRYLTLNNALQQFTFVDVEAMDLSSEESISAFFINRRFDLIIHCAAYTAVDLAEQNSKLCFAINTDAVRILSAICAERQMRLIYISTDYVFDGEGNVPLTETSTTNPLSVYGKSKLEGEFFVNKHLTNAYIIRTSWVYSTFGKNFVKTITKLANERESINVIVDQIGSPTYARDLATAILRIADNIANQQDDVPGIYHFSNEGAISWFDFAHFIVAHQKINCNVLPIRTAEYKTLAVRPRYTVMDKSKIRKVLSIRPPHWHDGLLNYWRDSG